MSSRLEIFLVILCLSVTGFVYSTSARHTVKLADGEFELLSENSIQVLRTRMMTYLQSVKGTAAFVAASDFVDHDEFKMYVSTLNLAEQLPSITGLGLIADVADAELDEFANTARLGGQPEFVVRNKSQNKTHYIIRYIEPIASNSQALGFDLSSAPGRSEVLEKGRVTGKPQMTPPVQLVQESLKLPGFALFMPIYAENQASDKLGTFKGWVSAAFVAKNLFKDLTIGQGDTYQIRVSDSQTTEDGITVFDGYEDGDLIGEHSSNYQLEQFGRTWTITYNSTPAFDAAFESYQPLTILVAGLTMTAFFMLVLRNMRLRAENLREIAQLRERQATARKEENRSIVENAVTSVLVLDADDNISFANQAAQHCFGYSDVEMTKLHFSSLAGYVGERNETHNAIGYTKRGQRLELDLQRNAWKNSEGQHCTTAIIRDLTDQNNAQRDLKRNRALYDMALQGAEIGVFDIDLTTGQSEVSETWCRIMGYELDCSARDTQSDFMSRMHPDDLSVLIKADTDCIDGKTERSIAEYRLKMQDGSWCWMRSDAVVVGRDEDGNALRMIGTQSDVTTLRHDRNALEASEKLFRSVLANAPIGMALMDDSGKFMVVNAAFCELAGSKEEELLGSGQLTDLMPRSDRKAMYKSITQKMQDETTSVYTAEHRILCEEGNERWGLVNVSWSFDKNQDGNFFIAQIIDITDQKRLDMVKNEFVSTVSHELRTPLTSIKGALGLLTASKDINLSKPQKRLVEIASSNADRLTVIVNDILDLEKISSGQVTFDIGDLNLGETIKATVKEMSPFASTHDSTLRFDLPNDTLDVLADQSRTKQVLANLISNACKYSDPDSEVLIKAERINGMAIVYVQNTGSGVPNSFKSRIFQAFSQADSSDTRARGGTGLGLNITRQIVLRHGGEIGFESVPDGVTVFWFTMPLAPNLLTDETPLSPPLHSVPKKNKISVLHVEDNHDFAEVVSRALGGFSKVLHAKSIATAKKIINCETLDVIILDWGLPDGDAGNLLEEILISQPQARVIALSADGERDVDPRLFASMIKSRTEISAVVASVNHCRSLAS